jgi:hypothetical protein
MRGEKHFASESAVGNHLVRIAASMATITQDGVLKGEGRAAIAPAFIECVTFAWENSGPRPRCSRNRE